MKLYEAIVLNEEVLGQTDPILYVAALKRQNRIEDSLPGGSGFDLGTTIERVTDQNIVFWTAVHRMEPKGVYDGWTEHRVVVSPATGLVIHIDMSIANLNHVRDRIEKVFNEAMAQEFEWVKEES